jgi:hypothetical protein
MTDDSKKPITNLSNKKDQEKKVSAESAPQNDFQLAIYSGNSTTLSALTYANLAPPTSYLASISGAITGFVYDETTLATNQSLKLGSDQMQVMAHNLIKLSSQEVGSRFLKKANLLFCDLMVNHGSSFFIKRWIDAQSGLFIASFLRQFTDTAGYTKIIHKLLTGGVSDAFAEGILLESGYDMIKYVPGFIEAPIAKFLIAKPNLMLAGATSSEYKSLIESFESVHKKYQQAKSTVSNTLVSGLKNVYTTDLAYDTPGTSIRAGIEAYSSALGDVLGLMVADSVVNRYMGENQRDSMYDAIDGYFPTSRPDSQQKLENRDLLGQHYSVVFNKVEETGKKILVKKTMDALKNQLSPEITSLFSSHVLEPIRSSLRSLSIPDDIIEKIITNQPLTDEDYNKIQSEKHHQATILAAKLTTATWGLGSSLASAFTGKVTERMTALTYNAYTKSQQENHAVQFINHIRLYISENDPIKEKEILEKIKAAVKDYSIDSNTKSPTEKNKYFIEKLKQENQLGLFVSLIDSLCEKSNTTWFPGYFSSEKEESPTEKENKKSKSIASIQLLLHFGIDPSVMVKKMSTDYSSNPQAGVNAIQVAIADITDDRLLNSLVNLFLDYNCNFLPPTALDSETALSIACYKNKKWLVQLLLSKLPPHEQSVLCSMKNRYGVSALDHVTYQSNKEIAQIILDATSFNLLGSNPLQTLQLAGLEFIASNLNIENLQPLLAYQQIDEFNFENENSRRMIIANLLESNPSALLEMLNNSLYIAFLIKQNDLKNIQYVEYLIQKIPGLKCLTTPDKNNAFMSLKKLLEFGADDALFDKIFSEAQSYHAGKPRDLIFWHNSVELLGIAIKKGNLNAIEKLLSMNPDLANCSMNVEKDTPLHYILKNLSKNSEEVLKLFIKHGASIFLQNKAGESVIDANAKNQSPSIILHEIEKDLMQAFSKLTPELQKHSKFVVMHHLITNAVFKLEDLQALIRTFSNKEAIFFKEFIGLELAKLAIIRQTPENSVLTVKTMIQELLPLEKLAPWELLYLSLNKDKDTTLLVLSDILVQEYLTPDGFESDQCLDLIQKYIESNPKKISLAIEKVLNHSSQKEKRIADILKWLYNQSKYPEIQEILDNNPDSIHYLPSDSSQSFAQRWNSAWTPNLSTITQSIQDTIRKHTASTLIIHAAHPSTPPSPPPYSPPSPPAIIFSPPSLPKKTASSYAKQNIKKEITNFLNNVTENYAHSMSDSSQRVWGGDIEIEQIGLLLNLKIMVHSENGQINSLGSSNNKASVIHLRHESGNHYVVANSEGKKIGETKPNGNCLFEAVLLAQKLLSPPPDQKTNVEDKEIGELRRNISDALLKIHHDILSGATQSPPGFKGKPVSQTLEQNDPVYIRFNAIFEAQNQKQLNDALAYLPRSDLRDKALAIKMADPSFNQEARNISSPKPGPRAS